MSDLTGERGVLMGAIYGLWLAQYEVLRAHGHSASEAFNETVEEATQSLYPLIAENGMDWMYRNCSTTAQRGALDWFTKFRDAVLPVFEELYRRAASIDARISLSTVYRTVNLFEEAGLITKHDFKDGRARFELIPDEHHDHLIDIRSGKVIEFRNEEIEAIQEVIAKRLGYRLVDHRLELYAVPMKAEDK